MTEQRTIEQAEAEIERLRVQLAGCSVAALGHKPDAIPYSYGWSPAYQDVVDLRKKYEALKQVADSPTMP